MDQQEFEKRSIQLFDESQTKGKQILLPGMKEILLDEFAEAIKFTNAPINATFDTLKKFAIANHKAGDENLQKELDEIEDQRAIEIQKTKKVFETLAENRAKKMLEQLEAGLKIISEKTL